MRDTVKLPSDLPRCLEVFSDGKIVSDYITPLFWMHGESHDILLEEIERMHSVGVRGFIIEARPFPEFLEQPWWDTVSFILAEAKKRGLKVFIFDDIKFPSGFAAGRVRDKHPDYLKLYLRKECLDAIGPVTDAFFLLGSWVAGPEKIVRAVAAQVTADDCYFDASTAIDVTHLLDDNSNLSWSVPPGRWKLFFFISTQEGGEGHTREYINPINPAAVRAYLDEVYEPHFTRFESYFGNTLEGFFSDEPRFGSAGSYESTLGNPSMVIPYSEKLLEHLADAWGSDFTVMLPSLWHDGGLTTSRARFTYMDVVSDLYARHYTQQIGDWCRSHRVKYIGHVVEDNGAHTRLGYGTGHFFRAMVGHDWSGMDVVLHQLLPERHTGKYATPFGTLGEREYCSDFFYWGLTKLATSAGHLDPKKNGITFCEAFGAYGWNAGLKLMTWMTNHFCVRGVNHFVPHAFSPQEFPDVDCPPHFYARGNNPQWRYFKIWADYTNRICHLLSGGRHIAPVAVVYHAEAEWMGDYDPFEKVVKLLSRRQIDCDVVPFDLLQDPKTIVSANGALAIHDEVYHVLVVPYSRFLPHEFIVSLTDLAKRGLHVVFLEEMPIPCCLSSESLENFSPTIDSIATLNVLSYEKLSPQIIAWDLHDISVSTQENDLRHYHYVNGHEDIYLFVNESTSLPIDTVVSFRQTEPPTFYRAIDNLSYRPGYTTTENGLSVELYLEPYQSAFIIFSNQRSGESLDVITPVSGRDLQTYQTIEGPWKISTATAKEFPRFTPSSRLSGLGDFSATEKLPQFSGTVRYETQFTWEASHQSGQHFIDLGTVYEIAAVTLNGKEVGVRIAPPYRFDVTPHLQVGSNHLQIDVTNTLAKQVGDNAFDRAVQQEPSGLFGPIHLKS